MSDATRVKTTKEAMDAALFTLSMQFDPANATSNCIIAPFIEGPPGVGKTEVTLQLAREMGIKRLIVVSCGVIDTNLEFIGLPDIVRKRKEAKSMSAAANSDYDFSGLEDARAVVKEVEVETGDTRILEAGDVEEIYTKWIKPDRLAQFDSLQGSERGLLVFDDTHFLLERQQAMIMQLLTNNRTIHTHQIGQNGNVGIMFLANRLDDNAGAQEMLAPVIDRVQRIVIDLDPAKQIDSWIDWAEDENLNPGVIIFLKNNPEMLYTFQPETSRGASETQQKFASPRGWANLARQMDKLEKFTKGGRAADADLYTALPDASPELRQRMAESARQFLELNLTNYASGTVGGAAAKAFAAHYKVYSKYDLDRYMTKESFKDIPNEELSTAAYRFGASLGKLISDLDEELFKKMVLYTAENVDVLKKSNRTKSLIDRFEAIKNDPGIYETFDDKTKSICANLALVMMLVEKNLVDPPAKTLRKLEESINNGSVKETDLSQLLKNAFSGTLKALKSSSLETQYTQTFTFIERFIRHLYETVPEKRNHLCSTFFGSFAGDINRRAAKRRGSRESSTETFRDTFASDAAAKDLFLEVLARKSPQLIDFISSRTKIGEIVKRPKKTSPAL